MEKMVNFLDFYKGKKVLITGHSGFKGSWMSKLLTCLGSEVAGYSLTPPTNPSLYELADIDKYVKSTIGDIRDFESLTQCVQAFKPEIVIHMAAQPLVRESYLNPVYNYETNVMGTVFVLEAIKNCASVKSFVNVTTDKVYKNNEWHWGYRETEELNGFDPYSNSKSCSDIITSSYRNSFFEGRDIAISTTRAGNVIGGGDFAKDRIIPDCVRAGESLSTITLRNPHSIRPYQHVLEPVVAYLVLASKQYLEPKKYEGSYNIGPNDSDCITTGNLATIFCEKWGEGLTFDVASTNNVLHEANYLKLDISKAKSVLSWTPTWNVNTAIEKTVEFAKCRINNGDLDQCMENQINEFLEAFNASI